MSILSVEGTFGSPGIVIIGEVVRNRAFAEAASIAGVASLSAA